MRLTWYLLKQSPSSSRWTARQAQDPYVRLRATGNNTPGKGGEVYRSRSAFKLISISRKYPSLLKNGDLVVDLGAAPGGWSQVASREVGKRGKVWALDILGMDEVKGVDIVQGDFLSNSVKEGLRKSIKAHLSHLRSDGEGKEVERGDQVNTVLSDMMAPMSGIRLKDVTASLDLVEAATEFAKSMLKPSLEGTDGSERKGGNLVLKYFAHPDLDAFKRSELDPFFSKVLVEKPKESRKESSEAYWICLGYHGAK